jgi:ubiquitin
LHNIWLLLLEFVG